MDGATLVVGIELGLSKFYNFDVTLGQGKNHTTNAREGVMVKEYEAKERSHS